MQRGEAQSGSRGYTANGVQAGGRYGDNRESRIRGYTDHGDPKGARYGDNRESGSGEYTDEVGPGESGTAAIERAEAEAVQITRIK